MGGTTLRQVYATLTLLMRRVSLSSRSPLKKDAFLELFFGWFYSDNRFRTGAFGGATLFSTVRTDSLCATRFYGYA